MNNVGITKKVMAAAFAVAGLAVFGQDAQAQNVLQNTDNNDKGRMILTKSENVQYMPLVEDVKFMDNKSLALGERGLMRGGSLTGAAAPTPTLDSIKTDSVHYLDVEGGHKTYTLSTAEGSNTHSIYINGIKYWYTPNEEAKGGYTADQLNAMLVNLVNTGSAAMIDVGEGGNWVLKLGDTCYGYDTTKLPVSAYTGTTYSDFAFKNNPTDIATFANGASGNYDFKVSIDDNPNHTKYYNINIDLKEVSSVGSKLSDISWSTVDPYQGQSDKWKSNAAGSIVTFDDDENPTKVYGAVRLRTSHNSIAPSSWNHWFTYTYKSPYGTNSFIKDYVSSVSTTSKGSNHYPRIATTGRDANVITNSSMLPTGSASITNKVYANNLLNGSLLHDANLIGGSAILNRGTIGDVFVDFIGNMVIDSASGSFIDDSYGIGAVANLSRMGRIEGDFVGNYVYISAYSTPYLHALGGAIANFSQLNSAQIDAIVGDFVGNVASAYSSKSHHVYGGAIYNGGYSNSATIGSIEGDFIGNCANGNSNTFGGAISNHTNTGQATIGSIKGNFVGNYAKTSFSSSGGAIYNYANLSSANATIGSIEGDFVGNYVYSSGSVSGGAIYNERGKINSITGDFVDNYVYSSGSQASSIGGAIRNTISGVIGSIVGDFIGNYSYASPSSTQASSGGAIQNTADISSIVGDFVGNYAYGKTVYGGAISNDTGTISSIVGDFVGNYASSSSSVAYGGAIYNGSLSSSGNPSYSANAKITLAGNTFTGNYVQRGTTVTPNSIYNAGIINIADGATVTINDGYDGLSQAQLKIGTTSGSGSIFNLSVDNGVIQTDNLGTVTNNGTINWDLDVDFSEATQKSDLITVNGSSTLGSILIRSINLMADPTTEYTVNVATADSALANALYIAGGSLDVSGTSDWIVTYNNGVLTFAPDVFVSGGGTIDDVRVECEAYLKLASGSHGTYSDLVTTKDDDHPDVVVINGTVYYFKAAESTAELTNDVRNLAATGASAIKEVTDSDNWIFSVGGKYYTYNKKQLPKSAYTISDGSETNYTYYTYADDNVTKEYHSVALRPADMKASAGTGTLAWSKQEDGSGYDWDDQTTFPAKSTFKYVESDDVLVSADGEVRFKLPGTDNQSKKYYKFDYTPSGEKNNAVYDLEEDFNGGYFYNINESVSAISISDDADGINITADFINNYCGSSGYGAAIRNDGAKVNSISANFIANFAEGRGGAISNSKQSGEILKIVGNFVANGANEFGGAIYNESATIGSITGDFIGNSASSGGAIYNDETITSITGDFIGNSASSSYGGAISNSDGTIGSITGDFIGNSADSGGAIYNDYGTISSITGDFIGNSSSFYGGAIYNDHGTISSITGDFIGNSAYAGGAIYTYYDTIGEISGTFIDNKATGYSNGSSGGALALECLYVDKITANFINNGVIAADEYTNADGGAVALYGTCVESLEGDFTSNYAIATNDRRATGGALGMYSGSGGYITYLSGDFTDNRAISSYEAKGGAIYRDYDPIDVITNSKFVDNYAQTDNNDWDTVHGGAIYNGGNLTLSADGNVAKNNGVFTISGNYISNDGGTTKQYEAIYVDSASATFTFNAVNNGKFVINDYINGFANVDGAYTVAMTGDRNLSAETPTTSEIGLFNDIKNGNVTIEGVHLNFANGETHTYTIDKNLTITGTISHAIDVDFADSGSADRFTVTGTVTAGEGSILINTINLVTDASSNTPIDIALVTDNVNLAAAYDIDYTNLVINNPDPDAYTYSVVYTIFGDSNKNGKLTITRALNNSLAKQVHAVVDPGTQKVYEMAANEIVGEDLGALIGENVTLTVTGGGYAITGGEYDGITTTSDQTLIFNNVSDVTGFADDTAVTNGGSLEITGSTFTSKIENNASMTLKGTNTLNGAISGTNGQTVISTGTTTVGADLSQKDLTVESGAGLTIAANNLNITNAVKNDGTVTLTDGTLSSSIANNTGTTGKTVIDGDVTIQNGKTVSQAIEVATGTGHKLTANVASIGGAVTNNADLVIFSHDPITSDTTHFAQAVTGDGTTTIQRNVNVDSTIANNVVIDKYVDTSSNTYYANVVVGENGTLGAAGKTITIKAGNEDDTYNTLTANADKLVASSIANDGRLVLTGGTIGADITKDTGSGGIVDITAGTGTVSTANNITNQTVNVNTGTLHLTTTATDGSNLSGSTVNVANSAILSTIDGVINNYSSIVKLANGATVKADINFDGTNISIDNYGIADGTTSINLGAISAINVGNFQSGDVAITSDGVTVNGESIEIFSDTGKTVTVKGSGQADGKVKVSESTSADKLNGAVYTSETKSAITYTMGTDETVNHDRPALGYIKDEFEIKSNNTTQKVITADQVGTYSNTKGLIVDTGKELTVDNVKFQNFATGVVDSTTYPAADRAYDGNYEGIITVKSGATLNVKDSHFAVSDTDGNTKKIAIANYGTLTSDPTTYEGAVENYRGANATITGDTFSEIDRSAITGANGGAIYNEAAEGSTPAGILVLNKVTATGNKAVNGGALYNAGIATINGGTYSGNSATSLGGAIYSSTSLTVNADAANGAVAFSNNKHQTAATEALNDIYMAGGTGTPVDLNLNAADTTTNTISLGSGVAGTNYNVNVNDGTTGKVSIASLAGAGTIALKGGELDLTSDTSATSLTASDVTTLNAVSTNGLTVGTLTVADNGTFTNTGKLSVTTALNNGSTGATGTITNTNAVLNLLGGTSATAPMTNIGSISGGNINIGSYTSDTVKDTAYVVNSGSITGEVSVAKESTLQTAANTVTDTTGIANAGKLTLTGGNLASAVSGTGVTNVIGTVINTDAKEIANALEITNTGKLTTATSTLTSSTTTKNAGTLTFNNASDGELRQSITDNGTHGTVEIDADGKTIDMNGQTITNNTIKLTSGTLKATGDNDGNVDLSVADKIEANGGTLNVQDGKMGNINLGKVDTNTNDKDLNVAIDADFMHDDKVTENDRGILGTADVITAADTSDFGDNKINVSSIKLVLGATEDNKHPVGTEFTAKIASGTAANNLGVSETAIDVASDLRDGVGNILLAYTVDSANDGYLTGRHSTLDDAITSSVDNKMYFMDTIADADRDATITGPKTLNGNSLAITTNGNNISLDSSAAAGSNGIIIGDASRTLSIKGTKGGTHSANTTISGFGTAIDNTAGGKVNLTDVTMEGNIKDIINDGEIDSSTTPATEKGVFLAGTNNINSIVDSDGSATHGQTTVKGGTSTIDTIKQKSVTVDADATANLTNVDNVKTTDGITNDGDLVLAGGTADTPANNDNKITMTADAGNAKTTIASGSNVANNAEMTQKEVVVSATDGTNPAAILTNNDDIYANTVNVEDGATLNNNKNITASDVNVKSNADLNLNKDSNTTADVTLDTATSDLTITDNGTLSGDVISDNGGSINLVADQDDITMSDAITGAIKGSVDPATGQPTDGSYIVTATTSDPTGADKVVTIDKAIAGATEVDVNDDTNAVITDTAYTSTSPSTPATVKVGNNGELTLKNTTSDEKDVISAITGQGSDDKYDVTVANTNAGTTNINNTISGAKTVTGDGGTTNLNSTITGADKIVANAGTTNINAGSNNNTSTQIGTADIDINSGATAGVKTTSDNFALTNDVTGADATSTLKLDGKSGTAGTASDPGTQFNIASDVNGGTVEIANGQLNLPSENKVANADGVKVDTGATLNTMNGAPTTYNTNTEFEDASQIKVDVNAISKASDRFANPQQAAGEGVVLTDLALQDLDKIVHRNTDIDLRNTTNLSNVTVGSELLGKKFQAMTPIRMMEATIDQNAMLNIHPSSDRNDYNSFNPAVVVAPIAAQMGGYLSQLNSYDEAFRNLDMKMLMTREERQALKMANRYASEVQPHIFSETYLPEKSSAGWFRPYASFEKVGLKNGPRVENIMYGSYFGGDSQMYETKNGWDYQYSVYIGYNGSHQNYQGNSIYQNGGNIGATGVWYKKDFFTALTANVGASVADASTMYGHEDFPMLMTGVASKTGYNWELAKGKFIIQPSYTMSYTFVNTFNYTNAAGVGINSDPLHAINIAPGLKFIGNLKNGWQPYAGVQMVWNIMDKTDFHANDIALPELSVKPYFQYGVGIQKRWGERFTGFGQAMLRNGGRNGIALSAGFRWAIGKAPSATSSKASKATTAKTKQTVLKQQTKRGIKSSSERKTKLSNFFGKMDGEPTYIVNVIK